MTTLSSITDISDLDLTDETLGIGDDDEFVTKMAALNTKIDNENVKLRGLEDEVTTAFDETETALTALENGAGTSASNIATNVSNIATNASAIGVNATNIATNTSGIATNTAGVATNSSGIATNASNIATNTTNIGTNTSAIATNASNISTNASDIIAAVAGTAAVESMLSTAMNCQYNPVEDNGALLEVGSSDLSPWASPTALFRNNALQQLFSGYNGSDTSLITESDRSVYNSSTYGGSEAATSALAQSFVDFIIANTDATDARYMESFAIGAMTTGAGVSGVTEFGCYPFFVTTRAFKNISHNGNISISFLYRNSGNDSYVKAYASGDPDKRQTFIDGVLVDDTGGVVGDEDWHLLSADTVYHLAFTSTNTTGAYTNHNLFYLIAPPLSTVQFALPRAAPCVVQLQPDLGPVRSIHTFGM